MAKNFTKHRIPKKYPGFRPCLNHCILEDMFKNPIPELCPQCFASTAKHQIQLTALNYCSVQVLRDRLTEISNELERFKATIIEHIENQEPT